MAKIEIIAEAGVNHNGDIELAKKLIEAAKNAGADFVKFQTFDATKIVSRRAQKADYQKATTDSNQSQLDMLKKLELTHEQFCELSDFSKSVGIKFISTPFDLDSISFLSTLDMPLWKVPSGEITNLPYLIEIARTKKPVVMSTGMCDMEGIFAAVDVLKKNGTTDLTLLHCNTQYPTPYCDVNLRAMYEIRNATGLPVGYSDHTQGIEIPIAAAAMGACIIEKHFTLDRNLPGPDHKASLEPDELATMVHAIRNVEAAMGSGEKKPSPSEQANIAIARKSIVAARAIVAGETFTEENLMVKRPGSGISPMRWFDVIGKCAPRDFEEDELITL